VNLGKKLSYVWDTTECRLLYAWTDGFLDMKNYWGDKAGGRRKGFGYVPELYGFLFYKAQGKHPIHIDGKSISELGAPKYQGYDLDETKQPVFSFSAGKHTLEFTPRRGPGNQTLKLTVSTTGKEKISFKSPKTQVKEVSSEPGKLVVVIRPNAGDRYSSDKKAAVLKEATVAKGEELYNSMGCVACHTIDGGLNHGPTFKGLAGSHREFISASAQKADDAYLIESIQNPGAKTVKGYLMGMMPPYQLQPLEYDSLVLFIKKYK
jgi:mono/diheme cytochrome c family protein